MANKRVTITRDDDSRFSFLPDQREDQFADKDDYLQPVRQSSEKVKKEAMETREAIRKAGLLP